MPATVKSMASFSQAHYDHTIIVHGLAKAWSMTKTGGKWGMVAAAAYAAYALVSSFKDNPDVYHSAGVNPEDAAEILRLQTELQQMVNDAGGADSLPPDVQKNILKTSDRILNMVADIANKKALTP